MADRAALPPRAVAALLRAAGAQLASEIGALPEAVVHHHPATGEWCVKEVVGHLIEAERRGFAGRVRTLLAENNPTFVTWAQDEIATERKDCSRDGLELLVEFEALRSASADLVAGLRPSDLTRSGRHPKVGVLTIGDLLAEWVHHDRNHIRQIHANVQSFVWPHMGNAQKFSRP